MPAVSGYPHKPTKLIEVDGETVRVRYPDATTIKVWEYIQAGHTRDETAVALGYSISKIDTELRLYRETAAREWPLEELRSELATLAPKAKADIEAGLAKGTGYIGIKLMEGLGVLNPKLDLRVTTDNQPTEDQLISVCKWAKDIPALRAIMLNALGAPADAVDLSVSSIVVKPDSVSTAQDIPEERTSSAQGILCEPDPGTPEDNAGGGL